MKSAQIGDFCQNHKTRTRQYFKVLVETALVYFYFDVFSWNFLWFFSIWRLLSKHNSMFSKNTIVEIRPPIKVYSHCSARYSRSTKNAQNRVFLQISDQIPKGFKWFQLFENMIAVPPSKLISFFSEYVLFNSGKIQ